MNFETIIGLECHVELKTQSKMFSPAPAEFGADPNENTNEIDWGYPGVLPKVNKQAIEYGMKAALALNCEITQQTKFDRKNYFYPDNPKAYQISQFDRPIGVNGYIEIEVDGETKKIRIERVHLEEDAGKNTHGKDGYSYVDLNRQGTPLIEIVSEADIRSPEEAYAYLEKLKQVIQYTGVSDVKMEEGSMRADANISLRPFGQKAFGVKTELKNLNSFNNVRKGLTYEVERQAKDLLAGKDMRQETRRYDETTGETVLMRVKEGAADYRYFPEPDIPAIYIEQAWIDRVAESLPELAEERIERYVNQLGLSHYDAAVLTSNVHMSDFFDATVQEKADAKQVANWLMGDISAYLNKHQLTLSDTQLTPVALAEMVNLIEDGTISSKIGKKVYLELLTEGSQDVKALVESKGWVQLSDPAVLMPIIEAILDQNEQSIQDYKDGKDRAKGFLVGQIMQQTRGKANPQVVQTLLTQSLDKRA